MKCLGFFFLIMDFKCFFLLKLFRTFLLDIVMFKLPRPDSRGVSFTQEKND